MISAIKKLLGIGPSVDLGELIAGGATIVDVRSAAEYTSGHVKGSMNIPLDRIHSQLSKLDKNKPVITCCASGMRSGAAKSILKSNGFTQVYNGGSWHSLIKYKK